MSNGRLNILFDHIKYDQLYIPNDRGKYRRFYFVASFICEYWNNNNNKKKIFSAQQARSYVVYFYFRCWLNRRFLDVCLRMVALKPNWLADFGGVNRLGTCGFYVAQHRTANKCVRKVVNFQMRGPGAASIFNTQRPFCKRISYMWCWKYLMCIFIAGALPFVLSSSLILKMLLYWLGLFAHILMNGNFFFVWEHTFLFRLR